MGYYASCTGITGIKKIAVREDCGQPCTTAEIECTGHNLAIYDAVTIDLGTDAAHEAFITDGYVKEITQRRPGYDYVITVHDKLTRAVDYFIAPDDPSNPYRVSNMSAEDLSEVVLGWAGITGLVKSASGILLGTQPESQYNEISRVSAWEYVDLLSQISGFMTYAAPDGTVYFSDKKPYVPGAYSVSHEFFTGTGQEILAINYRKSADALINRIVVYGAPGIQYTAEAVSLHLPPGFYKSAIISFPLIDTQLAAQTTGDEVLDITNRLTENVTLTALGVASVHTRSIVEVTESFTGFSATPFFVQAATHTISQSGYGMELELIR